ncbi:BatA domain-containing protein [Hymenobacter jeollabukensis]|uniref:BatA domain-containing protein n=1 Tax=Hymenobacter jeollabukensis TaxID=2025313 RepID=UPI001485AC9C|nr:BatA domain-containing protein [Hymenobacter jeollabukensis]
MLFFANPAALWALLGLLVPLAIHLWNRRPGRVVPVGALRWLTAGANRRMRRLHLTQWPLLLLRLTVVAVLAAALLGPRWQRPARPARPQVLVSPEALASPSWPLLRSTVDSLRRRGAELRLFAPGFPRLADSVASQPQPLANNSDSSTITAWFWPLAAEAADSFPSQPLYLFTSASLAHFAGSRPALPPRLRWQLLPLDSATRPWLQAAARPTADSLWLTIGRTDASGITFRRRRLAWPQQLPQLLTVPGLPPLQLRARGAGFVIQPADSTTAAVPVVRPLRIGIGYDSTRRADVRYVRAALRAAAPALPAGLLLRMHPAARAEILAADSLDWLLWLTDAPLPAALNRQVPNGLRVLHDAPGPGRTAAATVAFHDFQDATTRLLRRSNAPAGTTPCWTDATNQPVLSEQRRGRGADFYLCTRFHPQWSTLPDDGQLPALLLSLLDSVAPARPEVRSLDARQLRASGPTPPPATPGPARRASRDLRPWLALAAGLLFGLERVLASRRLSRAAA